MFKTDDGRVKLFEHTDEQGKKKYLVKWTMSIIWRCIIHTEFFCCVLELAKCNTWAVSISDTCLISKELCISTPSLSIFPLTSCLRLPPVERSLPLPFVPGESPQSPLALLLSSLSVRLLQEALLPLCLARVLPLEDMHPGSCCSLLCVLINILAASGRKWVFL